MVGKINKLVGSWVREGWSKQCEWVVWFRGQRMGRIGKMDG